jgi:urea transport system permease protein
VDTLVIQLLNLASLTVTLVLVSIGLGVVLSLMGIINLAHGEFLMLGAYTVYLFNQIQGIPSFWVGLIAAPLLVGVIALGLERSLIRLLYQRPLDTLLATWGLGIVLREGTALVFGSGQRPMNAPFTGSVSVLGVQYPAYRMFVIVVGIAVLAAFVAFFTKTSFGLRVRATIERPEMAEAIGINTKRVYQAAFALGAAMAGLAGALIAPIFVAAPGMGLRWLVPAFLVVIVGGMGSIYAAVVGGIAIALVQSVGEYFLPISLAQVVVFLVAILVVRLRPRGLLNVA